MRNRAVPPPRDPYLPRRENSPPSVVSPTRDELRSSCKRLVEPFKEISEKLACLKVVSGSRDRKNRAYFLLFTEGQICR